MGALEKIESSSKLNFISNLIGFLFTYSISFFLSPYIVGLLGEESYGFVSLAQNFTNYISVATVALNSMASRFISIALYENDVEKAKRYYTSVIIANSIITAILVIPCAILIWKLEYVISIPVELITDVKILFAIIFLGFFITLLTSLFSVGVFVENKLYLNAVHNIEASIVHLILTLLLFKLFPANVIYVGIVSVVCSIYRIVWQYYYLRKFQPALIVDKNCFDKTKIGELLKAGSWSLVGQLSYFMNSGFDLLLTNQFVSSSAMGVLAISATLPGIIRSIFSSVSTSFTPDLTKLYAEKRYEEMSIEINKSFKLMNLVLIVPLAGLTIFGGDFYALWQPTQDAGQLHLLSTIKVFTLVFTAGLASVHEIFTIANKLKPQSLATLVSGICNIIAVLIVLNTTSLGVIAIAGIPIIIDLIRNFTFTIPYASKCIQQSPAKLYFLVLRAFLIYCIISGLYYLVRTFIWAPTTWFQLILLAAVCGIIGYIIVLFCIYGWAGSINLIRNLLIKLKIIKVSNVKNENMGTAEDIEIDVKEEIEKNFEE